MKNHYNKNPSAKERRYNYCLEFNQVIEEMMEVYTFSPELIQSIKDEKQQITEEFNNELLDEYDVSR